MHDFIINHFIFAVILFLLICVFEGFLTFKCNWKYAIILPLISFILFIPRIIYLFKGGHFMTDFFLFPFVAFILITSIFIIVTLVKKRKIRQN
mgnify:CR=1 FL=1